MKSKGANLRVSCFLVSLVLVFLSFLLLSPQKAFSKQQSGKENVLKIGYLLCVSGWYSVFDAVEEGHVKIVAKMINDRGGLLVQGKRYMIELVGEDGKSSLDGIAAGARKLVYDHRVKFVIGPTGFFSTASSPIFEQNKVLHVSGYNTCQPGELGPTTPYGFLGFDGSLGTSIASWKVMKREFPQVKKVAITTPDDGAVPYLVPIIRDLLNSHGYSIAGEVIPYPNEMEDFSPIAAKVNSIKDADGLFCLNGSPIHHGNIAKHLRAMGNNMPIVLQSLANLNDVMAVAGKAAANNITGMGLTPNQEGNPPLLDEVFERSGRKLPLFLFNPNGLWILAEVIKAANSLDPKVVKAKWEEMEGVDCLFGPAKFGGKSVYNLKNHATFHPLPYQKLVNGNVIYGGWVNIDPIP